MFRWAKNILASIFIGFATSGKLATEATIVRPPMEPVTTPVRKRYQGEVTIAGGPGSQKIGDTFDNLPKDVKDKIIAARGRGGYNRRTADKLGLTHFANIPAEHPAETLNSILGGVAAFTQGEREKGATDKIRSALAKRCDEVYALRDGKVVRTAEPDKNPRPPTDGEIEV